MGFIGVFWLIFLLNNELGLGLELEFISDFKF